MLQYHSEVIQYISYTNTHYLDIIIQILWLFLDIRTVMLESMIIFIFLNV